MPAPVPTQVMQGIEVPASSINPEAFFKLTRRWPAAPGQQAVVDVSWVPKPAADDYRPLMADKLRSGELLGPADLGRGDHR